VSEALVVGLRRAGEAAPIYTPLVVTACIRVMKETRTAILTSKSLLKELLASAYTQNIEEIGKVGSIAVGECESNKSDRDVTDKIRKNGCDSHDSYALHNEKIDAVRQRLQELHLLRQSALSLMAEACTVAGWAAAKLLPDVLDIAIGVLSMERPEFFPPSPAVSQFSSFQRDNEETSEFAPRVSRVQRVQYDEHAARRSAAFLLRYVITSIREKVFFLPHGHKHISMIYEALKILDRPFYRVRVPVSSNQFFASLSESRSSTNTGHSLGHNADRRTEYAESAMHRTEEVNIRDSLQELVLDEQLNPTIPTPLATASEIVTVHEDRVVLFHVRSALAELNELIRSQMTLTQSALDGEDFKGIRIFE